MNIEPPRPFQTACGIAGFVALAVLVETGSRAAPAPAPAPAMAVLAPRVEMVKVRVVKPYNDRLLETEPAPAGICTKGCYTFYSAYR